MIQQNDFFASSIISLMVLTWYLNTSNAKTRASVCPVGQKDSFDGMKTQNTWPLDSRGALCEETLGRGITRKIIKWRDMAGQPCKQESRDCFSDFYTWRNRRKNTWMNAWWWASCGSTIRKGAFLIKAGLLVFSRKCRALRGLPVLFHQLFALGSGPSELVCWTQRTSNPEISPLWNQRSKCHSLSEGVLFSLVTNGQRPNAYFCTFSFFAHSFWQLFPCHGTCSKSAWLNHFSRDCHYCGFIARMKSVKHCGMKSCTCMRREHLESAKQWFTPLVAR